MLKGLISIIGFGLFVVYFLVFSGGPVETSVPWKTRGEYFTIEWIAPPNAVFYKAFVSSDRNRLINTPFQCRSLRMPPPKKAGEKQQVIVRYRLETFTYDLYIEIYAFDMDGNYWNIDLLHIPEEV